MKCIPWKAEWLDSKESELVSGRPGMETSRLAPEARCESLFSAEENENMKKKKIGTEFPSWLSGNESNQELMGVALKRKKKKKKKEIGRSLCGGRRGRERKHRKKKKKKKLEFPLWLSELRTQLLSVRMRVPSLALLSGLRIPCRHKVWRSLQMRLGSGVAVAVAVA